MVKSVRFKNIVIFSLSFFPFFGSFAFGMKRFFNLFCCCGFKEKNPEKYLGGVDINELPYDCMTEVISFLKQKEALGLRSVNRFFAKLVYRSPTVKKNMIFRKGKAFESFSKRVLPQNISFLLNLQKLTLKFWQECDSLGINKLNFPSSKLKNLKVLRYDNFGKKEIVFPPLLNVLNVHLCSDFGKKEIVFPPLLKVLKVSECSCFGFNKVDFPPLLKKLKVSWCYCFGKKEIVLPLLVKKLKVISCKSFGKNTVCASRDLENLNVEECFYFNEEPLLKYWKNGKFPKLKTYNGEPFQYWKNYKKE